MGFDKGKEDVKPVMSLEMIKSCKNAIAKFGFERRQFEEFLRSVWAMKGDSITTFPLRQIDQYRDKFIRPYEHGLNDTMMFDELAKVRKQDEKKWYDSGDFCPRYFWDAVLKMK